MDYARFNYVAQPGDSGVALMPNIGIYDKHAIRWGYRPILEAKTAEDEKQVLDSWILEHAGDPMYRYAPSGSIDPSSQTEDLGDDAIKASEYGIANLKRIVPKLIEWTSEDGETYADLKTMYGQVLSQYNRYMGHVTRNIGGVYQIYKTSDQDGEVFSYVTEAHQKACMKFINQQLFVTPSWLIDDEIFKRTEFDGFVERIRGYQTRTINNVLDFGRMARMIENEALNGAKAYTILEMMTDLRRGVWSELTAGRTIDTYRRNLQRSYLARMEYLMTEEQPPIPARFRRFSSRTNVNVAQSDIRPVVRGQLNTLLGQIKRAIPRTSDTMSKYHLQDAVVRIDKILNPKD